MNKVDWYSLQYALKQMGWIGDSPYLKVISVKKNDSSGVISIEFKEVKESEPEETQEETAQ